MKLSVQSTGEKNYYFPKYRRKGKMVGYVFLVQNSFHFVNSVSIHYPRLQEMSRKGKRLMHLFSFSIYDTPLINMTEAHE